MNEWFSVAIENHLCSTCERLIIVSLKDHILNAILRYRETYTATDIIERQVEIGTHGNGWEHPVGEGPFGCSLDGRDGQGYALAPKKVGGALVMISSDNLTGVYLPDVEMFASFNGDGGDDSTGYYNVAVTPLTDASGAAFYPLSAVGSSSSD